MPKQGLIKIFIGILALSFVGTLVFAITMLLAYFPAKLLHATILSAIEFSSIYSLILSGSFVLQVTFLLFPSKKKEKKNVT